MTAAAVALTRLPRKYLTAFSTLYLVPIMVPGLLIGVSLLVFFSRLDAAIRNVRVCDPLPDSLSFKRSAPRARRAGDSVCWRIPKLGAGATRSFEVLATMRKSKGRVTNLATAKASGVAAVRGSAGVNAGRGACLAATRPGIRRC